MAKRKDKSNRRSLEDTVIMERLGHGAGTQEDPYILPNITVEDERIYRSPTIYNRNEMYSPITGERIFNPFDRYAGSGYNRAYLRELARTNSLKGFVQGYNEAYEREIARNPEFAQTWDMASNVMTGLNLASSGAINRLSPSQNIRTAIDTYDLAVGNMSAEEYVDKFILGNEGVLPKSFTEEHPFYSMLINGAVDGAVIGGANAFYKNRKRIGNYLSTKNPYSTRYSKDRIERVYNKYDDPRYIRSQGISITEDEAQNLAHMDLFLNKLKHDELLASVDGELQFFYPDPNGDGFFINDDAYNTFYRINVPGEKYPNPIRLTREEYNIRQIFPEYYVYAKQRGLPIDNEDTFKEFLDRMSTSTRGVTLKDPSKAEEYLTTAGNAIDAKPGGDRLGSHGGLYTSNSEEIADRFSRNIESITNNPYGAKAKLYHNFDIDYNLPISKRLQQLRNQIIDVETIFKQGNIENSDGIIRYTPYYNDDPSIHAIEHNYMGNASKERAYIGHFPKEKVVNVIGDIDISKDVGDRHHRWSPGEVKDEEGLFIPTRAAYTKDNIDRYKNLIRKHNTKLSKEIIEDIDAKQNRVENIRRKSLLNKVLLPTSIATGAFVGSAINFYKKQLKKQEERNKEYNDYYKKLYQDKRRSLED